MSERPSCGLLPFQLTTPTVASQRLHVVGYPRVPRTYQSTPSDYLDADFETVDEIDAQRQIVEAKQVIHPQDDQSLIDAFLSDDPDMEKLPIPFVDGDKSIDIKLGLVVEMDGVNYGIGIPYNHCAAITVEKKHGEIVTNVSPDDDDNVELMEIMATQLKENVGEDLQLIRSPRVLTISGPLDKYTKNWKEEILPKSFDAQALLDDKDEDVEHFLDFMKKELGEEEFSKTMNEEHDFDDDVLSLFSVAGLGDRKDEMEQFIRQELTEIASTMDDETALADRETKAIEDILGADVEDYEGTALKLVSYCLEKGAKRYSLVKLMKPIVLVAKQVEEEVEGMFPAQFESTDKGFADNKNNAASTTTLRYELLSKEEMKLVVPRLEEVCQDDLRRIGLNL